MYWTIAFCCWKSWLKTTIYAEWQHLYCFYQDHSHNAKQPPTESFHNSVWSLQQTAAQFFTQLITQTENKTHPTKLKKKFLCSKKSHNKTTKQWIKFSLAHQQMACYMQPSAYVQTLRHASTYSSIPNILYQLPKSERSGMEEEEKVERESVWGGGKWTEREKTTLFYEGSALAG